uniref:Aminotransferase-like plant mobile domain-containing protein n=1 Tax=Vitis vinifera TaxID=29760 RepID=F6I0E8_VITVI
MGVRWNGLGTLICLCFAVELPWLWITVVVSANARVWLGGVSHCCVTGMGRRQKENMALLTKALLQGPSGQRLARFMREWPLDHRVRPYIIQAGFYGVYRVGFIQLDWTLITALVERWRQETHTFHLAVGESTITLQDTAVLLGLRVHGDPVTGTTDVQWPNLCEELLGRRPDGNSLQGSALKLSWLRMHFLQPPSDADDLIVQQYARAYILALIGGALFADKSGSDVQLIFLPLLRDFVAAGRLSWGSATLAHLYRELCRASKAGASEIAGPLILLQLWAWERLHVGRPEKRVSRSQHMVIPRGECVGAEPPFLDVADGAVINDQTLPVDPLGCISNTGFQPTAVTTHLLVQSLTNIHKQCGMTVSAFNSDDAHSALINIQTICSDVLRLIGEGRQLEVAHKLAPPPPSVAREPVRQQCRGRARGGRHGIIHPAAVSSLVSPATLAISLPDASVKARDDKPFLAPSLAAMSASAASPKPQTPSDPDSIEGPSRVAQEVASSILSTTITVSSIRKRSRGRGSSKGHLCGPTENVGIPIVIPVDRSSSQPPPSPRVASKATVRLEGLAQVTQGAASTPLAELASLATPLDTAPSPSMVLSEAMTSSTTVDINPIEGLSEVIDKSAATPPPTSASPSDDFIEGMSRSTQVAALAPPPTAATPLVISANVAPLSPSAVASEAVVSSIAPPPSVISSIEGPSQVTKNAASAPSPIRVTAPPSEGQGRGKVVRVDLTKTMPTSSAMPSDPPASLLNIISKRAKHL